MHAGLIEHISARRRIPETDEDGADRLEIEIVMEVRLIDHPHRDGMLLRRRSGARAFHLQEHRGCAWRNDLREKRAWSRHDFFLHFADFRTGGRCQSRAVSGRGCRAAQARKCGIVDEMNGVCSVLIPDWAIRNVHEDFLLELLGRTAR